MTRPGDSHAEVHEDEPRALPPTVVMTSDGFLRFVTPLRCPSDTVMEVHTSDQVTTGPNLATVVVSVVVTALGGIALAQGASSDEPASSEWTYVGGAGVIGGLTFAIGPWIGNGVDVAPRGSTLVRTRASEEPCGEHGIAGREARIRIGRQQVVGAVDEDGRFAISPFLLVDAFAIGEVPALDITAELEDAAGETHAIEAVIEASALAQVAGDWIATTDLDARKETLRKIPRLEAGTARVTRRLVDGNPTLHVVVPLANQGPGDAWQVRGILSSDQPEIDGRIAYVGHVAPGAMGDLDLSIPLSSAAALELAGVDLELEIEIRAADGTGPEIPVKFRGRVLADLPQSP